MTTSMMHGDHSEGTVARTIEQQTAKLVTLKEYKLVRFRWIDDEPQYFFEMEIIQDELTNDVALSITDFAAEDTINDRKLIWDNQVEYLVSVLGA